MIYQNQFPHKYFVFTGENKWIKMGFILGSFTHKDSFHDKNLGTGFICFTCSTAR